MRVQSRSKSSTVAKSRSACAATAKCGEAAKPWADSWLLALAHMATQNWRVASGEWWAVGVMVSPVKGLGKWGGFARLARVGGAWPCQQNVGALVNERCTKGCAKAVPESL